jgi:hypothetical protein
MYLNRIYRDPNSDPAQGTIPDPTLGAGGGDGTPAAPARDFGRDIDSIRGEFGGFQKDFKSFLSDFNTRFAPPKSSSEDTEPKWNPNFTQEQALKYVDDRSKWNARQEYQGLRKADEDKASTQATAARRSANLQEHIGRMSDARGRYKDYDAVIVNAAMTLPPAIQDDVMDSDVSGDLHYQLSKNQGDLYKLLSAYQQSERKGARVLGEMEANIRSGLAARKALEKKTRFEPTGKIDSDAQGAESEENESVDIARSSFGLKKK